MNYLQKNTIGYCLILMRCALNCSDYLIHTQFYIHWWEKLLLMKVSVQNNKASGLRSFPRQIQVPDPKLLKSFDASLLLKPPTALSCREKLILSNYDQNCFVFFKISIWLTFTGNNGLTSGLKERFNFWSLQKNKQLRSYLDKISFSLQLKAVGGFKSKLSSKDFNNLGSGISLSDFVCLKRCFLGGLIFELKPG